MPPHTDHPRQLRHHLGGLLLQAEHPCGPAPIKDRVGVVQLADVPDPKRQGQAGGLGPATSFLDHGGADIEAHDLPCRSDQPSEGLDVRACATAHVEQVMPRLDVEPGITLAVDVLVEGHAVCEIEDRHQGADIGRLIDSGKIVQVACPRGVVLHYSSFFMWA